MTLSTVSAKCLACIIQHITRVESSLEQPDFRPVSAIVTKAQCRIHCNRLPCVLVTVKLIEVIIDINLGYVVLITVTLVYRLLYCRVYDIVELGMFSTSHAQYSLQA